MVRSKVVAVNMPSEPVRERKRAYHHGRLREALVEAGIAALAAEPHEELRVRELARRVGVSPNAAYRHFADRDALLAAVAAEGFRRFGAAAAAGAAAARGARDGMTAQGRAYVAFARENPALFRLMFGPLSMSTSDELARASSATFEGLRAAVASALPEGERDERAVAAAAVYAWSVAHGLSYLALDGRLAVAGDVDDLIEAVLRLSATAGKDRGSGVTAPYDGASIARDNLAAGRNRLE